VFEEFGVTISKPTLSRVLRAMGLRKLSARPQHHAQDTEAMEAFKNVWPAPCASGLCESDQAVCVNVSGLSASASAKMEIRASRSS
jgi:hypothetical protein